MLIKRKDIYNKIEILYLNDHLIDSGILYF